MHASTDTDTDTRTYIHTPTLTHTHAHAETHMRMRPMLPCVGKMLAHSMNDGSDPPSSPFLLWFCDVEDQAAPPPLGGTKEAKITRLESQQKKPKPCDLNHL